MPRVDETTTKESDKSFSPKKHTPWDALGEFANNLATNTKQDRREVKHVELDSNTEDDTPNGIQNGVQNSIQNGIQNGIQKGDKRYTKQGTGNKRDTKRYTKEIQTDVKRDPNGIQNGIQKGDKNDVQADPEIIHSISGIKRKVLFFIVDLCFERGGLTTSPINCREMSVALEEKYNSTKQAISRLKQDGLVKSIKNKDGRGGYACFKISEAVKFYVLEHQKKYSKAKSLIAETVYKRGTEQYTEAPVVSSSNYNNTTTNIKAEFQSLDVSPLAEIGFNQSHIIQIHREYEKVPEVALSADIIQDSINALAFDLKHNGVKNDFKKPAAVVLTSLLKKGKPYSSKTPEKYITPEEEAMQQYLAIKNQQQKNKQEFEIRMKEMEYNDWLSRLEEDDLLEFAPESDFSNFPEKIRRTVRRKKALEFTKDYFEAEVWPSKKKEIMAEISEKTTEKEDGVV